ncbi:hypothetical protein RHMOL_Rhmol10G0013500 [Rhododendron molle]|uniref:Uncharacterized protein n=1 Tax=Rhododendron molle TaxID=49168 RepID=A0ACC0LXV3_RHOML|nr:hypothetical protein RHMOL_Rhmol10G0013500 [Rhododendron molle]
MNDQEWEDSQQTLFGSLLFSGDPSRCIIPESHDKPIVYIPEGLNINQIEEATSNTDPLDTVSLPALFQHNPSSDCQQAIETVFNDHDWFPQAYIIGESLPRPSAPFPHSANISVLVPDPQTTTWSEDEVINIRVGSDETYGLRINVKDRKGRLSEPANAKSVKDLKTSGAKTNNSGKIPSIE